MRIRLNRTDNIIKLPTDFAKLVGIDRRGYFRYEISYQIDVANAVRNRVVNVQLNFKENTPDLQTSTIFSAGNEPDVIIDNVRTKFSKQRALKRQNASKIFFSFSSDPTKFFKKSGIANLRRLGRYLSRHRSVVMRTGFESSRDGKVRPILTQNRAQTFDRLKLIQHDDENTLAFKLNNRQERRLHTNAIYQHGIEPASYLGQRGDTKISSKTSRTGVIQKRKARSEKRMRQGPVTSFRKNNNNRKNLNFSKRSPEKSKKIPNRIKRRRDALRNNRGLINSSNPNSSKNINGRRSFVEMVTLENEYETITEFIDIPFGLILDSTDFLLEFDVISKSTLSVQKTSKAVQHDYFVSQYEFPKEPPYLKTIPYSNNSKAIIELEQNDENGVGVLLYRRIVPTDEVIVNSNFELIDDLPLTPEAGRILYYDDIPTTNPVIYRAITYNFRKDLSGEFSSAVVNNNQKLNRLRSVGKKQTYCAMTHKIQNQNIQIEIRNICPGPIALYVERADLTIHQSVYNKINSPLLITDESGIVFLNDVDVKEGRIYHYRCVLIYENGETSIANNDMIVEFNLPQANIVNVLIDQPEISKNPQEIDAKMTIQKNPILKDGDVIKGFLEAQGLSEQYTEEILQSREKLQSLFFTRVVRQNLITGLEEEFGALKSNEFSDFELGKIRNVNPLEEGGIYRYVFYTYSRDTNTMFDDLTKSVEQTTSSSFVQSKANTRFNPRLYTYSPSKWRHPIVLRHGNIVSNKSLTDNHSKSEFTIGTLVDVTYVDLDLTEVTPVIRNVQVFSIGDDNNLLTWEIDGNTSKIDHFIISVTNSEIKDVVGKTHNIDRNGKYAFVDTLEDDEEGEMIYSVTPVYFDMSFGDPESAEAIII